jgi:hypothetical protein
VTVREEAGEPRGFPRALGRPSRHLGPLRPLWDHERRRFAGKRVGSVVLTRS